MSMVETFHLGLIILDVIMESPDDGVLLAQQLRHEGWKMPILMMSSIARCPAWHTNPMRISSFSGLSPLFG
jgi:FixJ family two-component response regulator